MTLRRPPQGHCSTSSANTRHSRSAHGSRRERDGGGAAAALVVDVPEPVQVACSAHLSAVDTSARSFARCLPAGANTPLYLTRCRRGGGMIPTNRRKNATGSMSTSSPAAAAAGRPARTPRPGLPTRPCFSASRRGRRWPRADRIPTRAAWRDRSATGSAASSARSADRRGARATAARAAPAGTRVTRPSRIAMAAVRSAAGHSETRARCAADGPRAAARALPTMGVRVRAQAPAARARARSGVRAKIRPCWRRASCLNVRRGAA